MPVPNSMADLAQLASANFPTGTESIGNNLDNYLRSIQSILRSTNAVASATIASASTVDLGLADAEYVTVTGTTTINSFGPGFPGCRREVKFSGVLTINNSSNISLPGGANIVTAAGDTFSFRCVSSGVWTLSGGGRDANAVRKSGDKMTGILTMEIAPIVFTDPGAGTTGRAILAGSVLYLEAPVGGLVSVRGFSGAGGATLGVQGSITSSGGSSSVAFDDRSGGNQWAWYSMGGIARLNRASDGDKLTCDTAGNLVATGNVTGGSDERVKANWRGLSTDLVDKLAGLEKVGTYDRTDIGLTQTGVGAQSLREILPHTVHEDESGFLSVAYGNAALVGAIAVARRLVALEARVAGLGGG